MRSLGSKALAVGIAAIAVSGSWGGAGCSATKPTEIVPGALTQIQVPHDVGGIRVDVKANGSPVFCRGYIATDGTLTLPATLGVVPATSPATTLTVEVRAYDPLGAQGEDIQCSSSGGNLPVGPTGGGPRVMRRSIQTFVDQRVLFLPMPLSYSCFDMDCSSGGKDTTQTCKGGTCLSAQTDPHKLADFNPALLDGTQDCFSPAACMAAAAPPLQLPGEDCLFSVSPSAVGGSGSSGLNVRVVYQDVSWVKNPATNLYEQKPLPTTEEEILSVDPDEGFIIPDPAKPQQFKLAPGLCALFKASTAPVTPPTQDTLPFHSVSAVQVSATCAPRSALDPFCASEQKQPTAVGADGGANGDIACGVPVSLASTPSAIYLVMDDSTFMHGAYGTGYAATMNQSLSNPVFKHTYVALRFLSHNASECTSASTTFTSPLVDFGLTGSTQPQIATLLQNPTPAANPAPLYLQAAMRSDQGAYKRLQDFVTKDGAQFNVAAVMYFLNRQPDSTGGASDAGTGAMTGGDCVPAIGGGVDAQSAIETEAKKAYTNGLQTYFVVLDNDQHLPPTTFFKTIETDTKPAVTTVDATSNQAQTVLVNFANVATGLGTCLYDLPAGVDSTAQVSFTIPEPIPQAPSAPLSLPVPPDSSCNAASQSTANGWAIDNGRIRICGNPCQNLRATIETVTALHAVIPDGGTSTDGGSTAIPDVPVTVTMPCKSP